MLARLCAVSLLVGVVLFVSPAVGQGEEGVVRYDGHQLVRVNVETDYDLALLQTISPDLWTDYPAPGPVMARILPGQLDELEASGLEYEVVVADLGPMLSRHLDRGPLRGDFDDYMTYSEMMSWLNGINSSYSNICELFSIGQSIEGEDIWVLHITGNDDPKPAVFYHGIIHAREWIAGPVVMYLIDHLVTNYGIDSQVTELVDGLDIYLAPCVNPDGYKYTWTNERLWRKNRRNNGDGTYGVDLNRNWAYGWGGPGSSGSTWDLTYRGPFPFSEPETQALSGFIADNPEIIAYMDYHSYSELILWPFGNPCVLPPEPDRTTFDTLGSAMQSEIQAVHGRYYDQGPICTTIYQASGGSVDWVYGDQHRFSFTIELRPGSGDPYGFELPPSQIIPTCEENLPAIMHLTDWAADQAWTTLTLPNGVPETLEPGVAADIDVEIVPIGEALVPGSAELYYRYDGGVFQAVPLTHVGGELYRATLPAATCSDSPEYYFVIESTQSGALTLPADAPTTTFVSPVGEFVVFFADDFENDQGWTVSSTASDGGWNRGVPVNCSRGDPPADYDGSGSCYLTDNSSANSCNSDVDSGYTWLMSPTIDLSDGDADITYALWYTNDYGADPNNDTFKVYVSNNNGGSWTLVETIGPDTPGYDWFEHNFRVGDYVTPTAQVKVRFEASDLNSGSVVEAGVDAFEVRRLECEEPPMEGACCAPDGMCTVTLEADCGDTWLGEGTVCDPNPCPQPWCMGDLNCSGGGPDFADIVYFVASLNGEAAWEDYYRTHGDGSDPDCPWLLGDFSVPQNGVDFADILPFSNSVGGACQVYMP